MESTEDSGPPELLIAQIDLSIPLSYSSHIRKPMVLSPLCWNEVDLVPLACEDVQSIAVVTDQGQRAYTQLLWLLTNVNNHKPRCECYSIPAEMASYIFLVVLFLFVVFLTHVTEGKTDGQQCYSR